MHVNFAVLHTFIIGVVSFATVVWSRQETDVLSLPHRVGWEKSAHYETKKQLRRGLVLEMSFIILH